VAALTSGLTIYYALNRPMVVTQKAPVITLKPRATAYDLIQILHQKKLIASPWLVRIYLKLTHLAESLKTGVYQVLPNESIRHFIQRVVQGDVITCTISFIEGSTVAQLSQKLATAPYLNYQASDWQAIWQHYTNCEGLILANSYQYEANTSAQPILKRAHQDLINYLNHAWQTRFANLPYKSPYELLIAASIIEKETSILTEKRLISGVIVNRLRKKMPLQMDPTVIYGLGLAFTGKLTHQNMVSNSPYNTYIHRGLPPTPIAIVGKQAIDAAAQPLMTSYLYFVAKGDKTHIFSKTYEQQKKAIQRYILTKPKGIYHAQ
tara:strand:- start:3431 stop:4393 length:963 start_codon:yes stop_codon:yes gene_type:complete